MQAKLQFLDHQIVTFCIAMVNVVILLFIWMEMAWKIPNLENLEFYTCTLWDHIAKFLIIVYRRNSWVPNDSNFIGINETKWSTFDFMINDVLQNYLDQFLKCLADNFDNLHLKISGCQNYQPNISKIDLNNSVAHHFSWNQRCFT